jgi:hypothetical protein
MKKINFLQIIIHFIATYFFAFSATVFSSFYNFRIVKIILENGIDNVIHNSEKYKITVIDMYNFFYYREISSVIGIFIAILISIFISIKKKWSIINSFIVLLISFILKKIGFLDWIWNQLQPFVCPGKYISNLKLNIITSGIFLLSIGCLLFFSKILNLKIEKYSK